MPEDINNTENNTTTPIEKKHFDGVLSDQKDNIWNKRKELIENTKKRLLKLKEENKLWKWDDLVREEFEEANGKLSVFENTLDNLWVKKENEKKDVSEDTKNKLEWLVWEFWEDIEWISKIMSFWRKWYFSTNLLALLKSDSTPNELEEKIYSAFTKEWAEAKLK